MATVRIDSIEKSYGPVSVMKDVNLEVQDGEFLILVGPSGCGKSTLLRMIAGLEENTGGHIRIDGEIVDGLEPKERDIAMVFQNYALYPHKTVEKNLSFSLELARVPKAEIAQKVQKAAAILGLEDLLKRRPGQLSGGQRQRVAMGRAIVRDPKVFLFDEPLSNLDAKLRVQMRSEIKTLHHRLGATIIYVTHDQVEAMTMADRIVVMNGGRIEQVGTPLELYDRPENMFVATFIGAPSMNLLRGRVEKTVDGHVLRTQNGAAFPLGSNALAVQGREIVVGIRPEHVHIAGAEDADAIEATVVTAEPTGIETFVQLEQQGVHFSATIRERIHPQPGDPLSVRFETKELHVFDTETGKRIN